MSRWFAALAVLLAAVLVGCGHSKPKTVKLPPSVVHACPQALHAKGAMGECTPPQLEPPKAAK